MRNLITFLLRNSAWFLFVFLEIICFYFIFQHNAYQRSVYLNSSNGLVGRVYLVSGSIRSYFGLRDENKVLLDKNGELQAYIWKLEKALSEQNSDSVHTKAILADSLNNFHYEFIPAVVINNSIALKNNYMTLNKGEKDGVHPEMGVISHNGVVGVVRGTSEHFSVVQPLLSTEAFLSCKVKDTNSPGTLIWDAKDYRYASLEGFPRFEKFEKGDTIVTSGFSDFFPQGIIVGIVDGSEPQNDDNFLKLKVKLMSNFGNLQNVLIIKNSPRGEISKLEEEVYGDN